VLKETDGRVAIADGKSNEAFNDVSDLAEAFRIGLLDGWDILADFRASLKDEHVDPKDLKKKANRVLKEFLRTLRKEIGVAPLKQSTRPSDDGWRVLASLCGEPPVLVRYIQDHPATKRELAKHVAATFFQRPGVRCFVQASSTTIHWLFRF
jgi:hypothetical protein